MSGLRLDHTIASGDVGNCDHGCGRKAGYMVTAAAYGHSARGWCCGPCLNIAKGRALRMLADSLIEREAERASR